MMEALYVLEESGFSTSFFDTLCLSFGLEDVC